MAAYLIRYFGLDGNTRPEPALVNFDPWSKTAIGPQSLHRDAAVRPVDATHNMSPAALVILVADHAFGLDLKKVCDLLYYQSS